MLRSSLRVSALALGLAASPYQTLGLGESLNARQAPRLREDLGRALGDRIAAHDAPPPSARSIASAASRRSSGVTWAYTSAVIAI